MPRQGRFGQHPRSSTHCKARHARPKWGVRSTSNRFVRERVRQGSKRTASCSQAIRGFSESPRARAFASTQEAPTPWGRSVPRPARRTPWDSRNSNRRRGTSGPKASTLQPAVDPEKQPTHRAARSVATPKARRMSVQPSWLYPESNSSRSTRRSGRRRLYQPPIVAGTAAMHGCPPAARCSAMPALRESERCDSVVESALPNPSDPNAQQASAVTHEPCCCPCADGHEPSANCADRRKCNPRRISSRSSEDDSRRARSAHEVDSTRLSEPAKNPQPPSLFWVLRRNGMQVCAIKAESPSVRFSGTDCIDSYLTPFASSAERVPRPPPPPHLPAHEFPAG